MVERFHEVRRSGFLWLTKKTRTVEVTYTYEPAIQSAGESKVPTPMQLEERQVAPWARV